MKHKNKITKKHKRCNSPKTCGCCQSWKRYGKTCVGTCPHQDGMTAEWMSGCPYFDKKNTRRRSQANHRKGTDRGVNLKRSDCAKMREALKVIRRMVNEELEDLKDISDEVRADFISIRGWCDHALAAPPRNCERFQTWDEAKDAYWREQGDPCDWRKLGAWLFAPEGGVK